LILPEHWLLVAFHANPSVQLQVNPSAGAARSVQESTTALLILVQGLDAQELLSAQKEKQTKKKAHTHFKAAGRRLAIFEPLKGRMLPASG
jgi:hypothetical protein